MRDNENKAKYSLVLSMLIFGTIGIFRRYIPLPSSFLAMVRGFVGMGFLVVFLLIKREKISWKAIKSNLLMLCLSGAVLGFNWVLLFESYRYTSVAAATLCYYMAPVMVILVSPLLFKEKLTAKKIICAIVAVSGMIPVSGVLDADFAGISEMKGILLGLGAALLYALVVILNKKITGISAYDKTIVQLGAAAIVTLPYVAFTEDMSAFEFEPLTVVMLAMVGIVHTGIAYVLYFGSIGKLKAQTAALLSYIDPVFAIVLSAAVLGESVGAQGIIGAVLVLGSMLVSEVER